MKEISKLERVKHDKFNALASLSEGEYIFGVRKSFKRLNSQTRLLHNNSRKRADSKLTDTIPPSGILDELTPDDTRQLVLAEDELATSRRYSMSYFVSNKYSVTCLIYSRFTRIFPTATSHRYFK